MQHVCYEHCPVHVLLACFLLAMGACIHLAAFDSHIDLKI